MMAAAGDHTYRYLVIGAGPGGLQLSHFLHRAGADYLTLEREATPGTFFRRYPRHRRLISLNKVHSPAECPETALRWDWNSLLSDAPELLFPRYSQEYFPSADDLLRYLADFQRVHALNVRFGTPVDRVEQAGRGFLVHARPAGVRRRMPDHRDRMGQDRISLASPGSSWPPDTRTCRSTREAFAGQRVLIIGKGNSAFETAQRPARAHLDRPPGQPASGPARLEQQASGRRARPVRCAARQLLVQDPAWRARMPDRPDLARGWQVQGRDHLHARRRRAGAARI